MKIVEVDPGYSTYFDFIKEPADYHIFPGLLEITLAPASVILSSIAWNGVPVPAIKADICLDAMNEVLAVVTLYILGDREIPEELTDVRARYIKFSVNGSEPIYGRIVILRTPPIASSLAHGRRANSLKSESEIDRHSSEATDANASVETHG